MTPRDTQECPYCDGRGWNTVAVHDPTDPEGEPLPEQEQCATCGGSGEVSRPRDTQELVEAVRQTLMGDPVGNSEMLAALTEVAERLEAAERERDEYRNARRMMAADREALERDLASSQEAALLLHKRVEELERENGRLALEAATSDQDWKQALEQLESWKAAALALESDVAGLWQELAERDKRIQEAQVLLMEGAGLVLARDKRIEGLREALERIAEPQHTWSEQDFEQAQEIAQAALADPVVVPDANVGHMQDAIDQHNTGNYERRTAWEWNFKQEC